MLPVGGIKEKTIAAARAGIRTVLLPLRNRRDFEDIPASVRAAVDFHFVERVDQAVALALPAAGEPASQAPVKAEPALA